MGTQYFEGREHRYVDYSLSEVLHMFGKALQPSKDGRGRGVLMVPGVKREFYKKFLNEALPVESHLHNYLHDAFVTEISTRLITNGEDAINWTTRRSRSFKSRSQALLDKWTKILSTVDGVAAPSTANGVNGNTEKKTEPNGVKDEAKVDAKSEEAVEAKKSTPEAKKSTPEATEETEAKPEGTPEKTANADAAAEATKEVETEA
ncbi:hypothetical protein BN1723_002502 [Verticillium longisporum]|uniref:Uncharacterized protein n=1 Tax=Verticillium longisporum TaxID=100787 RepID=A0A0G4L8S9_VERLO|nr:hypothetical protein BN1723_002502 [Verticillium longisporum]